MIGAGRYTPERPGNVCLGRPSLIPVSPVLEQLSDSSTAIQSSFDVHLNVSKQAIESDLRINREGKVKAVAIGVEHFITGTSRVVSSGGRLTFPHGGTEAAPQPRRNDTYHRETAMKNVLEARL